MKPEYVFIACVKTKNGRPCQAKDMYISPMFRKAYQYALTQTIEGNIYILSAKYGLIHNTERIAPYEQTLNTMSDKERRIWAYNVIQIMKRKNIPLDARIMILGGGGYRSYLMQVLKNSVCPLIGKSMGRTLQWYNEQLKR